MKYFLWIKARAGNQSSIKINALEDFLFSLKASNVLIDLNLFSVFLSLVVVVNHFFFSRSLNLK